MSSAQRTRRRAADRGLMRNRVHVSMEDDLFSVVDAAAEEFGCTAASICRLAIAAGLPKAVKTFRERNHLTT